VGIQIVDTIKMGDSERTVDSAAHSMVQDLIEALATVEEGSSLLMTDD
ncbi:MAG: hypothetical protein ACI9A1_001792, partial [Lentimonas sp.]